MRALLFTLVVGLYVGFAAVAWAQAPNVEWLKFYGESNYEIGIGIQQTPDDGYLITGRNYNDGFDFPQSYVIKVNNQGDSLWARSFPGAGVDEAIYSQSTADNGYIVISNRRVYEVAAGSITAVKLDSLGEVVWEHDYSGFLDECAYDCCPVSAEGGMMIIGNQQVPGNITYDILVIHTDADGDTIWTSTFGTARYDIGKSIVPTADGGYLLLCEIGRLSTSCLDLVYMDADGMIQWIHHYDPECGEVGVSIVAMTDGSYAILSNTTYYDGTYHGEYALNLMKVRDDGEIFWSTLYRDGEELNASDIAETPDGGFIVSATVGNMEDSDQCFIRFNSEGDTLWTKRIARDETGMDFARAILVTGDGNYVMTGTVTDTDYSKHISLVNLAADPVGIDEPAGPITPGAISLYRNYPNPFNVVTTISYELNGQTMVRLEVYDILGNRVTTLQDGIQPVGAHSVTWHAENVASGIYFYKLAAGEYEQAAKMLLVK